VKRSIIRAAAASAFALIACTTSTDASDPAGGQAKAAASGPAYDTKGPDANADAKSPNARTTNPHGKDPGKFQARGKQIEAPPDVAGPPADAQRTASGIAYKSLSDPSSSTSPTANDSVKVEYTGWLTDGTTFDTSDGKGSRSFPLSKVIPGWTEGMQLMKVGQKMRFWIPEELAYQGRPGSPPGMLVFDVELLDVLKAPANPEDVAAPPADAARTEKGVAYKILQEGKGSKRPRPWDKVKVHYTGWTTDGKMFDSSVTRGEPAELTLSRVVPGWTEAIPRMRVGEKTRLWIPEELAYKGKPGAPQGMLVFDVELFDVIEMPEPPKTPEDVAAPPSDAKKTDSGLAYKVLTKGKSTQKPTENSRVTVNYSGWTTDGNMFDSSVARGQPATFPLKGVIAGWTEGLQLMSIGDTFRFWIPEDLAYKGRPGKPAGMLVFDVELLEVAEAGGGGGH
jgi:FKBP-type peptidyl-prolyl cis-trans isomerase